MFFGGGWPKKKIIQWYKDKDSVDLPKEAPEEFRKKMLRGVDHAIARAQKANAQGIIIWDIEGTTFPHATTYIGDPRLTRVFNPHMNAVADEMFARIHDAGLLSGVCIRPSQIVYEPEKGTVNQRYGPVLEKYPEDPVFNQLNDKIEYAKERWGCRIFYVDTAVFWRPRGPEKKWDAGWITADVWRRLLEKHPDILIIPEFGYLQDMAYTSLYWEFDMGFRGVPERMRRVYPGSWATAVIEDAPWYKPLYFERMVDSVRQGNALMTFGWITPQKTIYRAAKMRDAGMPEAVKNGSIQDLVDLLDSEDGRKRYYAAKELGHRNEDKSKAVTALAAVAENKKRDWLVRKNAIVSLGRLQTSEAIKTLAGRLKGGRGSLGFFAATALAEVGRRAVPVVLKQIEKGSQPALTAAQKIDGLRKPALTKALAKALEANKGGARTFQRSAIKVLGELASDEAVPALADTLKDPNRNSHNRVLAARALAAIGSQTARQALQKAREDVANAEEDKKKDTIKDAIEKALNRVDKK